MSEHYYRVGVHGQPKVGQWVMWRKGDWDWRGPSMFREFYEWGGDVEWFPIETPPSELAPEPEDRGVEVDGHRYKVGPDGVVRYQASDSGWRQHPLYNADGFTRVVRVAAALGLVDQPSVPQALIEWLRDEIDDAITKPNGGDCWERSHKAAFEMVLGCIEDGEFGPVEPTDAAGLGER